MFEHDRIALTQDSLSLKNPSVNINRNLANELLNKCSNDQFLHALRVHLYNNIFQQQQLVE